MIKGILFDMDGVLIDSEPVILQAAISYFADKGVMVKKEDFTPFIGAGDRRYLCGVAEKYGLSLDFDEERSKLFAYYEQYAKEKGPMPGVHRLIQNCKKAGLKLALSTGGVRMKVDMNLAAIGLASDDFDTVVTGDMLKRNKPYPDIYQLSAIMLGLSPEECLVVEDALNGIKAGKAAGATVCAVQTSFSVPELAQAGADIILSGLDAFEHFSDLDSFNAMLSSYHGSDGRTVYGANKILEAGSPLMGEEELLKLAIEQAYAVRKHAYTPYSRYKVGAAVVSARTNRIYSGCNVENSSYGATICAERNAILNAIANEGAIGVKLVVVVSEDAPPAPPCAECLQVLAEFSKPDTVLHLIDTTYAEGRGGSHLIYQFDELLPHPFIFPTMR